LQFFETFFEGARMYWLWGDNFFLPNHEENSTIALSKIFELCATSKTSKLKFKKNIP
jgi:hypothetical protein